MRIKDQWNEQRIYSSRTFAALLIIGVLSLTLLGKLAYLQIIRHDYYLELSQGNRVRQDPIPASRGLILDRRGRVLVDNEPAFQLELIPEQTPDLPGTLQRLARLGLINREDIDPLKRIIRSRRAFDSVPIRLRLTRRGNRPLRRAPLSSSRAWNCARARRATIRTANSACTRWVTWRRSARTISTASTSPATPAPR